MRQHTLLDKMKNPGQARYVWDASAPHFLLQAELSRLTEKSCAFWQNFGSGFSKLGKGINRRLIEISWSKPILCRRKNTVVILHKTEIRDN